MKAVVISERWDRKAAKYGTPAVPYPFDSRATYDRSLRQPLGRDFNTDEAFRCAPRQAVKSRCVYTLTLLLITRPRQAAADRRGLASAPTSSFAMFTASVSGRLPSLLVPAMAGDVPVTCIVPGGLCQSKHMLFQGALAELHTQSCRALTLNCDGVPSALTSAAACARSNLTRPAVLKEAGTVIAPLRFSQGAAAAAAEAAASKPAARKRVAVVSAGQPKRSKR